MNDMKHVAEQGVWTMYQFSNLYRKLDGLPLPYTFCCKYIKRRKIMTSWFCAVLL